MKRLYSAIFAAALMLAAFVISAEADATRAYPFVQSGGGGGGSGTTVPGGSDRQVQFNNAGAFGGSSNLILTSGLALVHGGTVSLTTASFIHKQGGTSSIDGLTTESPNGLVTARVYADSTYAYINRAGSAGSQIYIGATGFGLGTPPVAGVSLTVAGPVSASTVTAQNYDTGTISASVTSSYALNAAAAGAYRLTLTNSPTFTITGAPAANYTRDLRLTLVQGGTGSNIVTWPASIKWSGGVTPTLSTSPSAVDALSFTTNDAGTTWQGYLNGVDIK